VNGATALTAAPAAMTMIRANNMSTGAKEGSRTRTDER
jgi:hypothetical protein